MAITRSKKEAIVETVKDVAKNAKTIIFIHFKNVTSEEANALRDECSNENVSYLVAKKTLLSKGFENSKIEGDFPNLEGEIAVAYSDDVLASARVMGEQSKKLENRLEIVGGVYENKFITKEEMVEIANIPPLSVLYGKFVNVINSPIQGLVSSLNEIALKKQ